MEITRVSPNLKIFRCIFPEFFETVELRRQALTSSITRRLRRLDRMETKAISMKATRCSFVRSKIVFNRR